MTAVELIERKRDGGRLTDSEIEWLIKSYTAGDVADYQMSAMLMAIFINGLDGQELAIWTESMLKSGEVLELSHIPGRKVDKHSTGGVGDKVSIPLAPMVAACGVKVPMVSGRGLGHTGGTLDKLQCIPGFETRFNSDEFASILAEVGVVLGGQSERLVPADRKLYSLRDASGTVPAIPLISSSIMSKKLAEDLDGLVLDVKVGSGAFMTDIEDARRLAHTMVGIGAAHNTKVVALLTDMDQPLGREVGNASEIRESIDILRGEGPSDLLEITLALGAEMLMMGGITKDSDEARDKLVESVASGKALTKFLEIVRSQEGDPAAINDPTLLPSAANQSTLKADADGYVTRCDAKMIGVGAMRLGAGRERKEDSIDPAVGVTVIAKIGDHCRAGDPLATVHWNTNQQMEKALPYLEDAWTLAPDPVPAPILIIERISEEG